ncbi:hypothetical protein BH09GEM1_BH09GEM1_40390 [soil metagenome]
MIALDDGARDALRELVNIASGNAANALAQLVGRRTMISVPKLTFAPITDISAMIGIAGEPNVVVAMQVLGDVTGVLLFVMPCARAHQLSALLLGLQEPSSGHFDANGQSSLSETANILAGAYAGALGAMLGGMVMISVPAFGVTPTCGHTIGVALTATSDSTWAIAEMLLVSSRERKRESECRCCLVRCPAPASEQRTAGLNAGRSC